MMNLSLLIQLCGVPLLLVVFGVSAILIFAACYLVFSVRREDLLSAFLPFTALPLLPVFFVMFAGNLSSIGMQIDSESDITFDSGLALQMNHAPFFLGVLVSLPAALITVVGRWMIVWKASGIVLFPEPETTETQRIEPDEYEANETKDYLDQLIRPR